MTDQKDGHDPLFGTVVYSYSRAQAIADGVLMDVSSTAREAGITYPCAVTRAVWDACVKVPDGVEGQDENGRLWDVLWMLRCAVRRGGRGEMVHYDLYVKNHNGELDEKNDLVTLKAVCGPGDDPRPVITIMMPDED